MCLDVMSQSQGVKYSSVGYVHSDTLAIWSHLVQG